MLYRYQQFLERRPAWIAALAGVSALLLGALCMHELLSAGHAARLLPHLETKAEYERLHGSLVRSLFAAQAARRGYAISGGPLFVREYEAAAGQIAADGDRLRRATAALFGAGTEPTKRLDAALGRIAAYQERLVDSIATKRARPGDAAAQYALTFEGEALGHEIERELNAIAASARERFDAGTATLVGTRTRHERQQAMLLAASVLALIAAYSLTTLQTRRRAEAQRNLLEQNTALESTVAARTAALAQSEQRYRRLVELSADAIVVLDVARKMVYANAAALALTRAGSGSALVGRPLDALFPLAFNPWLPAWADALWRSPGQQPYRDAELCVGDGAPTIAVQVGAVSYPDDAGMHVQLVVHDMNEVRAKEQATHEQLRFVDQLVEAVPAPLSMRDERGRFVHVNRAYETTYGWDRSELRGRTVFDVLPPETAARVAASDTIAMRGQRALVYESRLVRDAAPPIDLLARAYAARRADGTCIGVITVDTDVSGMRAKEAALVAANAELEALSQQLLRSQENERRRIARDLHDQVGQILTVLKMSLQMTARRHPGIADALRPSIALADDALGHARSLTASLHPHVLEDLGLEAAANWLLDRFVRPVVPQVALRAAIVPGRSSAERELAAFRVVQEALTNVIRHANASSVTIQLETRDDCLTIRVTDDGDGFDDGASQFDRQRGTSLGIVSMRERVAEAGGHFGVRSRPGQGSVVSAALPW